MARTCSTKQTLLLPKIVPPLTNFTWSTCFISTISFPVIVSQEQFYAFSSLQYQKTKLLSFLVADAIDFSAAFITVVFVIYGLIKVDEIPLMYLVITNVIKLVL